MRMCQSFRFVSFADDLGFGEEAKQILRFVVIVLVLSTSFGTFVFLICGPVSIVCVCMHASAATQSKPLSRV